MTNTIIYHIDVNSAFLSWEAAERMRCQSGSRDLRDIPSVIGGSQEKRHGIVLAKSIPAKNFGIVTGEPLIRAREKCPNLLVIPPNYELYTSSSKQLLALLSEYAPSIEPYSIDEAFCDMTGTERLYGSPIAFAECLREEIYERLGITVNIGVSSNKLLAKMASDFQKPNRVHTLFPEEIPDKMWPLDVSELFFVGRNTEKKLRLLGIRTIGDLAHTDLSILCAHFKKHGETIYNYSNGLDLDNVNPNAEPNKGYGNSTTVAFDLTTADAAKQVLLSLCETVGARLRDDHARISVVSVSITDADFRHSSKQCTLYSSTDITQEIYERACMLFHNLWKGEPIRHLGVSTRKTDEDSNHQYNLFDMDKFEKLSKLDSAVDKVRRRFGDDSIKRACFLKNSISHMSGGHDKLPHTKSSGRAD